MAKRNKTATIRRGRPPRDDAQIDAMRARIAETAQRLFRNEGYSAESMRRIATDVGCTPMTLYAYFSGKTDILRQLWADVFDEAFAAVERAGVKHTAPLARLKAAATAYVTYWLDHPEHYRLVFMTEGVTQGDVSVFVDGSPVAMRFQTLLEPLAGATGLSFGRRAFKLKADCLVCGLHGIAHCLITISAYRWSRAKDLVSTQVDGLTGPAVTAR